MAASPSPRPVSPRPSVVVALTETGAPTAAPSAASASARRGPSLGRSPTTCTATLPISKPASRDEPRGLGQQLTPGRPGPLRAGRCRTPRRGRRGRPPTAARRSTRAPRRRRRSDRAARRLVGPGRARPAPSAVPASSGCTSTPMPTRGVTCARQCTPADRRRASTASASTRSIGRVTLKPSSDPGITITGRPKCSTSPASSDASSSPCSNGVPVRRLEHDAGEALRCLRGPQLGAVDRRLDASGGVDLLDGVRDRDRRHHGVGARAHRRGDGIDDVVGHQGAGGVVDQHDVDVVGQRLAGPGAPTAGGSPRRRRRAARCRRPPAAACG